MIVKAIGAYDRIAGRARDGGLVSSVAKCTLFYARDSKDGPAAVKREGRKTRAALCRQVVQEESRPPGAGRRGGGRSLEEAAGVASGQTVVVTSSCVLELTQGELDTEARGT